MVLPSFCIGQKGRKGKLRKNRTTKIVMIGVLSAIAFLLMQIKIPLFADFLKLEISDIAPLIGTFAFGPLVGIIVELMKNILDLIMSGSPTVVPIGHIANFSAGLLFILPIFYINKKFPSKWGLLLALLTGTLCLVIFMGLLNYYYYLPAYAKFLDLDTNSMSSMMKYLIATIIPFNLVKGLLISIVFYVIYPRIKVFLKKF